MCGGHSALRCDVLSRKLMLLCSIVVIGLCHDMESEYHVFKQ